MPTRWPLRLSSLLVALLAPMATQVWAEEFRSKPTTNPYKLQLDNASDYRLNGATDYRRERPLPAELSSKPHAKEIEAAAKAARLDPALVHAVIHAESRYRKDAVSNKGAIGLMQLMPETARRFGVEQPDQVKANLRAGTRYLRQLIDRYDGRLDLALAAYNAGEGVVDRYQGIPPYAETRAYVPAVMENYSNWRKGVYASRLKNASMSAGSVSDMPADMSRMR